MLLDTAIEKLGNDFPDLNWSFIKERIHQKEEIISYWPGDPDEDIMICVFKSNHIDEQFHRQDFFFLNFAYRHSYRALSAKYDNFITVHENECYIGQPFSGYALKGDYDKDIIIIGVLIQKNIFSKNFFRCLLLTTPYFIFSLIRKRTNSPTSLFI